MKDQRSIIIYACTTEPGPIEAKDYVKVPGPVWIRTEACNGTVGEALDAANPRPDEVVCNTHTLPPEPRFRLLEPGETIHKQDTVTADDGVSWAPVIRDAIGKAWDASRHYPTRRQLASWEDAY